MPSSLFKQNVPLSKISTFGIGGPARYFIEVRKIEEMVEAIKICEQNHCPYVIIGKGSNSLFHDKGFNGAVILNKIDFFETSKNGLFHVGAGYSFSLLGSQTARQGWSGLEFACGIPGSVGGAVFMNAGANGGETCQHLRSVDFVNQEKGLQTLKKEALEFSYRYSSFQKMKGAIVGATFILTPCEKARQKQLDILSYRTKTQPYGEKSAGCIFRNPQGHHAGALIEQCGLKGLTLGGAKISEKHANFIVNSCQAKSEEVKDLIETIKKQIKEKTGIELESEVRCIPFEMKEC